MGTPEFALPTLKKIYRNKFNIKAIFTQKSKRRGRGQKILPSPVQKFAQEHEIPFYTPSTLKSYDTERLIKSIKADVILVVAFGFLIPSNILYAKKYGCINLHPSALPKFRGASPLQHVILEGDKYSSICVTKMDEGLDTGPILMQKDFKLPERPTIKWLHDYCAEEGAKLVVNTLENIDNITPKDQESNNISYAQKLSKQDALIDWENDADYIDRKIRANQMTYKAYFHSNLGDIKIIDAEPVIIEHSSKAGEILNHKDLLIACKKNAIKLKKIQIPSKKPMTNLDFNNAGYELQII